ncbi:5805_t:CDS:2 [Funneliformis mosseae]|uniref:5805_t:CDS:1 n=1 Tax=Funneliformis mosseae TaxID=27381 RepID=A0A9N9FH90_FUNMO|nr:5805_t:CDS:2 [Funneliformis mosseae]
MYEYSTPAFIYSWYQMRRFMAPNKGFGTSRLPPVGNFQSVAKRLKEFFY